MSSEFRPPVPSLIRLANQKHPSFAMLEFDWLALSAWSSEEAGHVRTVTLTL